MLNLAQDMKVSFLKIPESSNKLTCKQSCKILLARRRTPRSYYVASSTRITTARTINRMSSSTEQNRDVNWGGGAVRLILNSST